MNTLKLNRIVYLILIQFFLSHAFFRGNPPLNSTFKKGTTGPIPAAVSESSSTPAFFVGKYYKVIGMSGTAYASYLGETDTLDENSMDPEEFSFFSENGTLNSFGGADGEEYIATYSVNEELNRLTVNEDGVEVEYTYSATSIGMDLAIDTSINYDVGLTMVFENVIFHFQEVDENGNALSILTENTPRITILQNEKEVKLVCMHCKSNTQLSAQFFDAMGNIVFEGHGSFENFQIPTRNFNPGLVYFKMMGFDGFETRGKFLVSP